MPHPKDPFTNKDLQMEIDEFEHAMKIMAENGLVTSFTKNGKLFYQLTEIGYAVGTHLISDPKMAN